MSQPNVRAFSSGWGNFNQPFNNCQAFNQPIFNNPYQQFNFNDPYQQFNQPIFNDPYQQFNNPCCDQPIFNNPCCPRQVFNQCQRQGRRDENIVISGGNGNDTIIVNQDNDNYQRGGRQVFNECRSRGNNDENVVISGGNGNDTIIVNQDNDNYRRGGRQIIEERRGPVIVRQGKTECRRP